jgi:broad specificity phosphatase PhoE
MSEAFPLLYCVRHGRTILNDQGCYRGPLDPPLDKQGLRDAHKLAEYFSEIDTYPVIYHSGKKRSELTSQIIANRKDGIELRTIKELEPLNVGHLAGEEKTKETEAEVRYHVEHPSVPIKDGESLNDFRSRVRPILLEGIDAGLESGLPVIFVVHSSIVHEVGEMLSGNHEATLVKPGGVACVYIRDGRLFCEPVFRPESSTKDRAGNIS